MALMTAQEYIDSLRKLSMYSCAVISAILFLSLIHI